MTKEELMAALLNIRAESWEMRVNEIPEKYQSTINEATEYYLKTKDEDVILGIIGACRDYITFGSIPLSTYTQKAFRQKAYLANPHILDMDKISIDELQDLKDNLQNFKGTVEMFYGKSSEEEVSKLIEKDIEFKKAKEIREENRKKFGAKAPKAYHPYGAQVSTSEHKDGRRATTSTYVQKGGAMTRDAVYGGRNLKN